jgi:hypothetical protein
MKRYLVTSYERDDLSRAHGFQWGPQARRKVQVSVAQLRAGGTAVHPHTQEWARCLVDAPHSTPTMPPETPAFQYTLLARAEAVLFHYLNETRALCRPGLTINHLRSPSTLLLLSQ